MSRRFIRLFDSPGKRTFKYPGHFGNGNGRNRAIEGPVVPCDGDTGPSKTSLPFFYGRIPHLYIDRHLSNDVQGFCSGPLGLAGVVPVVLRLFNVEANQAPASVAIDPYFDIAALYKFS